MQDRVILVQEEPRGPSQLIEIPVAAATQKVTLPDIQQLRSTATQRIIVKAMRLITIDVLTAAPTLGGVNAPFTELQKMSLVIYCEGWEKAQLLPILVLNDMTFAASAGPHRYGATRFNNWENIDWSKSYIQFANGTQSASAYNVIIDVEYIKLDADNNEIIGPS